MKFGWLPGHRGARGKAQAGVDGSGGLRGRFRLGDSCTALALPIGALAVVAIASFVLLFQRVGHVSQAVEGAGAWSGQRTGAGEALRPLWAGERFTNWVRNGDFAAPGEPQAPAPGWERTGTLAHSTVRTLQLFNSAAGRRVLEVVPAQGDRVIVRQWVDVPEPERAVFAFSAHALSTQGDARVYLELLDRAGERIGRIGWVMVGSMPASKRGEVWFDHRKPANYLGGELVAVIPLASAARTSLQVNRARIARAGIHLEAADGQHLVVDGVFLGPAAAREVHDLVVAARQGAGSGADARPESAFRYVPPKSGNPGGQEVQAAGKGQQAEGAAREELRQVQLEVKPQEGEARLGELLTVKARLTNQGNQPLGPLRVTFREPPAFGLIAEDPLTVVVSSVNAGERVEVTWRVTAQRPHEVNLGRPWTYRVEVVGQEGRVTSQSGEIRVIDPGPGRLFYVLTNDMEPMDSAGYPTRPMGNRNAWLDPEEFRVQMVEKPAAVNRIAERYSARWSHYIAWPVVIGAQWAAHQSATGAWDRLIAQIRAAVAAEAARGHQYAPHLHMDYDNRLPGALLSYHAPTDGFWANHRAHGWAHQAPRLGEFDDPASRTGSLFEYTRILEELTRSSQGQQLATRTGSFDFGSDPEDQRRSVEAFRRVGLWASSDAHGNLVGGRTSARYGENIYFTRPDNINQPAVSLDDIGIVQFLPTPENPIEFQADSAASANQKVDAAVAFYAPGDVVRPGIHGIVAFTHTMLMLGAGDWKSTTGGAFDSFDQHLAYVRRQYVDRGLVEFGTSNDLIAAWLDYYTPRLLAVRGPERSLGQGVYEYPIILLGRHIPIGGRFAHQLTVKYPLYLREVAACAEVWRDGKRLTQVTGLPTPYNDIPFTMDQRGTYTLRVYTGGCRSGKQ